MLMLQQTIIISSLLKIVKRISPATASMVGFSKAGFSFLPKMPQGCPWVKQQHARPGISHHFPYFLFHVGTIAMNGALLARAFLFSEFAIAQSFVCIFKELFAVVAEHFVALFVPTINAHHAFHRLLFLFDACHADFEEFVKERVNQGVALRQSIGGVGANVF